MTNRADTGIHLFCPKQKRWFVREFSSIYDCGCKVSGPLVSILTSVKGRVETSENFIRSVSNLRKPSDDVEIEHIIHDYEYTKIRIRAIERYSKFHTIYDPSGDTGLYDGFNKAFEVSIGDFIAYLNSDDWYETNFVFDSLTLLNKTNADWSFGDCDFYLDNEDYQFTLEGKPDYHIKPWLNFSRFHHTTVLCRRNIFEQIGLFPTIFEGRKLNYCADYAWFLEAQKNGFVGVYSPRIRGNMLLGGASTSNHIPVMNEAKFVASKCFPTQRIFIQIVWTSRIITYWTQRKLGFTVPPKLFNLMKKLYRALIFRSN